MILDSTIFSPISDNILEIMCRRGVRVGATEFQTAVNITFHEFESEVYDQEHSDMWNSLPQQFELLVGDCLRQIRVRYRAVWSFQTDNCDTGLGRHFSHHMLLMQC
jgi:hypothetical protein